MGRSSNTFGSFVSQSNMLGHRVLMPEEKLFVAVLSQAVHDVFSTHVQKFEREAAVAFFMNKSKRFRDICELAGREPQYVYEKIRKRILQGRGWNLDESMRKTYRTRVNRKRKKYKKKHLTGNAYYAAKAEKNFYYQGMGAKGGRPRIYNKIEGEQ
jgi:hypothetical protein